MMWEFEGWGSFGRAMKRQMDAGFSSRLIENVGFYFASGVAEDIVERDDDDEMGTGDLDMGLGGPMG